MAQNEVQRIGGATAADATAGRVALTDQFHDDAHTSQKPGSVDISELTHPKTGQKMQGATVCMDGVMTIEEGLRAAVGAVNRHEAAKTGNKPVGEDNDLNISAAVKASLEATGQLSYEDPHGVKVNSPDLKTVLPEKSTLALTDYPATLKDACALLAARFEKALTSAISNAQPVNVAVSTPRTPATGLPLDQPFSAQASIVSTPASAKIKSDE
jgi:hypothetical protein